MFDSVRQQFSGGLITLSRDPRRRHILVAAEIIAVLLVTILIAHFFYEYGGQISGSDMLGYINLGFRRAMIGYMLNRYVHIYGIRILTELLPSPLEGLRYYSAIAAGLTVILAYYSARSMSKTPQIMRGMIAVALLLGFPIVVDHLLAPQADSSAMVAVLGLTAIYVFSAKSGHRRSWVLRILGLAIFMAFKTKETTLIWSIALIGLGMSNGSEFDFRRMMSRLWVLIQGVFAGILLFAAFSWIFVGEPFFGLRISDWQSYASGWGTVASQQMNPIDIFATIVIPSGSVVFVLYLIAGLWGRRFDPRSLQPLWLVPLALLILLTITINRITVGLAPRHYILGFALIAVLGSQVAGSRLPSKADRKPASLLLIGTIVVLGIVAMIGLGQRSSLPFPRYYESILAPITLAVAFGLILFFPARRRMVELAVLFCLLVLAIYPIRIIYPEIAGQYPGDRPNIRFEPILAFDDEFIDLEKANTFVSSSLLPNLLINSDLNKLRAMFNVALNARTEKENFQIGAMDEKFIGDLELQKYEYALVTTSNWDWMRTSPQDRPEWRDRYRAVEESVGRFVLLILDESK